MDDLANAGRIGSESQQIEPEPEIIQSGDDQVNTGTGEITQQVDEPEPEPEAKTEPKQQRQAKTEKEPESSGELPSMD
ncbi:hypothetical protein D3C84_1120550 [compost metagenome]